MKSACAFSALALVAFSGHAVAQTTAQPTYYPQCWFWQLPDDEAFVRGENSLPHLDRRFVPALNVILGGDTTPEDAVTQGKQRVLFLHSLGLYYPDRFALLPQNFKSEEFGPPLSALIHPNDGIDLDLNNDGEDDWPRAGVNALNQNISHAQRDKDRRENLNPWLDWGTTYASNYHADFADLWRTASITFPQQPNNPVPNEMPMPARIMFDNEEGLTNTGGNMFTFLFNQLASDPRFSTHGIPGFPGGAGTSGNYVGHKTMQQLWNAARSDYTARFNQLTGNAFLSSNPWLPTVPTAIEEQPTIPNFPRYNTGWERWHDVSQPLFNQDVGIWYMKLCQRVRDAAKHSAIYSQWKDGFVRYSPTTGLPLGPLAKISNYGDFDCKPGVQDFGWHYDGKVKNSQSGPLVAGALKRQNDRGQYDTNAHYVKRQTRSSGRWFLRDDYRASADFSSPVLYIAHKSTLDDDEGVPRPFLQSASQVNPYVPVGHPSREEDRWSATLREHRQTLESIIMTTLVDPTLVDEANAETPWKTISPWIVPPNVNAGEFGGAAGTYIVGVDDSRRQLQLLRSKAIQDLQVYNTATLPDDTRQWQDIRSSAYPDFIRVYRQVFEPQVRWNASNYPLAPAYGHFEPFPAPTTVLQLGTTKGCDGCNGDTRPPVPGILDTNPRWVGTTIGPSYVSVHELLQGNPGNAWSDTTKDRLVGLFVDSQIRFTDTGGLDSTESIRVQIEAEVELLAHPSLTEATFTDLLATPPVPLGQAVNDWGLNLDVRGVLELEKVSGGTFAIAFNERADDPYSFVVPMAAPGGAGQGAMEPMLRIIGTQGDVNDPLRAAVSVRRELTLPRCIVYDTGNGETIVPISQFVNSSAGFNFRVSFIVRPYVEPTETPFPESMVRVRYDLVQLARVDVTSSPQSCPTTTLSGFSEGNMMAAIQQPSADVDRSGDITMDDADIFFNAFENGGGEADQNVDGEVTPEDIVQFLQSYSGNE